MSIQSAINLASKWLGEPAVVETEGDTTWATWPKSGVQVSTKGEVASKETPQTRDIRDPIYKAAH